MSTKTKTQIIEDLRPVVEEMRRISPDYKDWDFIERSMTPINVYRVIDVGLDLLIRSDTFLEEDLRTTFLEAAYDLKHDDLVWSYMNTLESWLYDTYNSLKYRVPKKERKKIFSFIKQKKYRSATKLLMGYVPRKRKFYHVLIQWAAVRTGLSQSESAHWEAWLTDFAEELRGQVSDESIEYFKKNIGYGEYSLAISRIHEELEQNHVALERPLYNKLKRAVSSVIEEDEDIEEYMKDIQVKE